MVSQGPQQTGELEKEKKKKKKKRKKVDNRKNGFQLLALEICILLLPNMCVLSQLRVPVRRVSFAIRGCDH